MSLVEVMYLMLRNYLKISFSFSRLSRLVFYLGSLLFSEQNVWKRVQILWHQFFQFSIRSTKLHKKIAHTLKSCSWYYGFEDFDLIYRLFRYVFYLGSLLFSLQNYLMRFQILWNQFFQFQLDPWNCTGSEQLC